jgi:hypothetical protein
MTTLDPGVFDNLDKVDETLQKLTTDVFDKFNVDIETIIPKQNITDMKSKVSKL